MGNLTQVRDAAQAIVYRDNAALEAVNDYRYDALYRLVEASGREHEGQAANGRTPRTSDATVVPLRASSPNDPKAMRRYVQRYRYDPVGNLRTLQHQAGAGSFRREYAYAEHGNRLRATGNAAESLHERYAYDVAGHMVAMPHLQKLVWDENDALEIVHRGTQQIWLQYAGGVRVRKLVRSGEGVVEDRVYLGAEELYTKRRAGAVVERTLTEHVGGALQVDIKLVADGKTIAKPVALRRYALADHLGSVKLEVDPDGAVIAYEEFHPYGTSSYRAMRTGLDAVANRYRYTGMERDEETGLAQHGARYYAAWLGRWTSADPSGLGDGVNRYAYCRGSPTGFVDTDGYRTSAPDDDMMAAPRSPRRRPWPRERRVGPAPPEPWELEFYDPDPMGTRFMDGMRGTHAAQLGSFGRLADLAVGGISDAARVGGVLYGVAMTIAVGPEARHLHFGLDVAGCVPGPVGMAADLLNAAIYSAQGDDANAALSAVSAIGGLYDAAKAAKYADELVDGAVLMLTGGGTKLSTRAARPGATPDARTATEVDASTAVERVAAERGKARVEAGKWDYIFGRAKGPKGAAHNVPRTQQNLEQMRRIGVHDNPEGRAILQGHFDEVVADPSNVTRTWTNEFGTFEIRESLLAGPGGAAKLETTWEVLEDGGRRLTTIIPQGRGRL